jgi:hypothetical protein
LQVAGTNSVRVEENDSWCSYTGEWAYESGFFSGGFALRASQPGDSVTVRYTCSYTHDLYLGTSLYTDRGAVSVSLDQDAATTLDCRLANEPAVSTRRKLRSNVAAGDHTVTIRLTGAGPFYFDFLEAAVPSDIPDPQPVFETLAPALDYSTDHSYKLPPARILWMLEKLGYGGPINEYLGVFWYNQRVRQGAAIPSASVTFGGTFADGDQVFLNIGDQTCGKSVFPGETPAVIARHFAMFINASYVGVWASASGNVLTVTARSPEPAYTYTISATVESATATGTVSGSLSGGAPGVWVVDPAQSPALNTGARAWHADMFRECHARGRQIVVAASMELVNPPEGFAALFYDGTAVETSVGFGSLKSTHCAFVDAMRAYHQAIFRCVAGLMAGAGLTPEIQFGEFLWWFFTNRTAQNPGGGMAFYHPEITAAAQMTLGRPLARFNNPTDDPGVNAGADATFLRNRLRDYTNGIMADVRSAYPNTRFELLYPYDVNHPEPAGIHNLGGALNRFINLPVEWETKPGSGLDRIKMEALDFGAWSRNLDLAKTAIRLPLELGWPADSVRYLVPVFRGGYPWEKEVEAAHALGVSAVNLWAFDHVCLYGWPLRPGSRGRAFQV